MVVKVLLVEDEPLWQQGIELLLSADPDFRLIGTADRRDSALDLFDSSAPDAVLLDWKLKDQEDGLAIGRELLEKGLPPERVILISGSDPGSIPAHPFLFVPKSRISEDLVPLLRSVTEN